MKLDAIRLSVEVESQDLTNGIYDKVRIGQSLLLENILELFLTKHVFSKQFADKYQFMWAHSVEDFRVEEAQHIAFINRGQNFYFP